MIAVVTMYGLSSLGFTKLKANFNESGPAINICSKNANTNSIATTFRAAINT